MNETELQALKLTQQAILGLIDDIAKRIRQKEQTSGLMTLEEVAQALRISKWRLYHVYKQIGLCPVKRFGRKLLFRRSEVTEILARKEPRRGRPPNRVRLAVVDAGKSEDAGA
ncbi:MAG: hypothetical protein WCU88_09865 [Elusimicrobiota bacterium]|jgi:predicted DNA-binding transcriptional regulator AlpA